MAWQDRIKEASYTSPSGVRITFDFENVSKSFDKKTTAFEFPDVNGTYVQDLGHTGNRYPLRVFFWGEDHDLVTNDFEKLLKENGIGILEHPLYGVVNVIPFGNIRFRNDLKTEANQTVIEVTFWETIELIYPINQDDPASDVSTAINDYNITVSKNFDNDLDLDTQIEKTTFKNDYTNLLTNVNLDMQPVVSVDDDVQKQFNIVNDSINNGINTLVDDPDTLASQTVILLQIPADVEGSISDRLNVYDNLLQSIIASNDAILTPKNDSRNINSFRVNDLYASTLIIGSIASAVNHQFITKIEALETAESIINQMNDLIVWRDDNFESLSVIDTGESYQQLQNALSIAVGFLVELSFSLKQERSVILEEPHTMIELISEFYPPDTNIDDELDFFIQSNNLTSSEILEIPRNREIVYYV